MVDETHATVLLPGGAFRRVRTRGQRLAVGQELWMAERHSLRHWRWLAMPAAAVLAAAIWVGSVPPATVADTAILSIDINPSINLDVSTAGVVLRAYGLDAAGRKLLGQVRVPGMEVAPAVRTLVGQAARDGYLDSSKNPTVVLGAVFAQQSEVWFRGVVRAVRGVVRTEHFPVPVVTVSGVSASLVHAMDRPQVSVGRYLLWKRAPLKERNRWSLNQVEEMPVAQLLPVVSGHTSTIPASTSTSTALSTHSTVPNLPVTVPSLVITAPGASRPAQTPADAGRSSPPATTSRVPPSVSIPTSPINTLSSVASQLGF